MCGRGAGHSFGVMQQLKQERPAAAGEPPPGDVLVAFGITSDLARQMTLRSLYRLGRRGLLDASVVGVAVDGWTVDRRRRHAREVIGASGEPIDDAVFAPAPTPYEVLLAALRGDRTSFARQDGVEESWRVPQPLLNSPPPVQAHAPGTWGPSTASSLASAYGGWHGPWVAQ